MTFFQLPIFELTQFDIIKNMIFHEMINKLITKIVLRKIELNYHLLSIRNRISKLVNEQSSKNLIHELYHEYIDKVISKEIFPQGKNTHEIFRQFRQKTGGNINEKDEKFLMMILDKPTSKWFVPHTLKKVNYFSEELMIKLVETGIKVRDPSFNSCFLNAATRIHDLKVHDYLLKRLPNASRRDKKGILRSLYWVRSRIVSSKIGNQQWRTYGIKTIFDEEGNLLEKEMEKEEFIDYKILVDEMKGRQLELLLNEFSNTNREMYKKSILYYLPTQLSEYPDWLKGKAKYHIEEIIKYKA